MKNINIDPYIQHSPNNKKWFVSMNEIKYLEYNWNSQNIELLYTTSAGTCLIIGGLWIDKNKKFAILWHFGATFFADFFTKEKSWIRNDQYIKTWKDTVNIILYRLTKYPTTKIIIGWNISYEWYQKVIEYIKYQSENIFNLNPNNDLIIKKTEAVAIIPSENKIWVNIRFSQKIYPEQIFPIFYTDPDSLIFQNANY